jgi:N,N'-diacetylchitobiose phosphorylase
MRYGHFDDAAKEYVITRPDTPRPWSNYLGSTKYGAITTNNAGGYSFYGSALSARFLRIRPNSVPLDQPGRYFYLRDNDTGDYWSASWQPVGKSVDVYQSTCRHGTAYTIITSRYAGIETETTYFVPLGQIFEYWRLRVTNRSKAIRRLGVFTYCEIATNPHMPTDLTNLQYAQFVVKAHVTNDVLGITTHPYVPAQPGLAIPFGRTWMAMVGAQLSGVETVRERFLGSVYNTYANPQAVIDGQCSNFLAEGENPCGVLHSLLELAPGETRELIVLLGLGTPESHGLGAVQQFGSSERCAAELQQLKASWHRYLDSVWVKTPDVEFDSMVNVWNAYNALVTYAWSRHASLIYNGERDGLGFRDTVQDLLGVVPLMKDEIRERLELMLTGQVSSGGALPVVHPEAHRPGWEKAPAPDSYRSDDCLWFFNTIPEYVAETGDVEFYAKRLPYADEGDDTVLDHMRRALAFNLERSGKNGLPCGLHADWNDCVKMGHDGESVMVALQLRYGLLTYAGVAERLGQSAQAAWARQELLRLDQAIDQSCWDGQWYLWAIGADGHRYGTKSEVEGQIYVNTQTWAVISGAANREKAESAMQALNERLATPYGIMLSAPPFTEKTPSTVMGGVIYNRGIKENAGIFCHTQGWAVMAEAMLGNGDRAYQYYRAYLPAAYNDRAELREIEPYVHCQTTYAPCNRNAGKSRVPWLSGTAAWSYHAAVQWILGVRPEIEGLRIDPCIPTSWPGFTLRRVFRDRTLTIEIDNAARVSSGVVELSIDGLPVPGNLAPVGKLRDGSIIRVRLGKTGPRTI